LTATNEESAEALASFFQSVFVHKDIQVLPDFPSRVDMHPYILDTFSEQLCKPLCSIFNQLLQSGQLPKDWKLANVTPVYKNDQRNIPNNYRPISLTSQACKILESIIHDHIIEFLAAKNTFSSHHHGFTHHKSCFTNLLETFEDCTSSIDLGKSADVISLDFTLM